MTKRDEIIDLLESALRHSNWTKVHYALLELKSLTVESELNLRLAEDLATVKRQLGPNAQLAFELVAENNQIINIVYSVGFGSKHDHTMDVHGRGRHVQDAIDEAQNRRR